MTVYHYIIEIAIIYFGIVICTFGKKFPCHFNDFMPSNLFWWSNSAPKCWWTHFCAYFSYFYAFSSFSQKTTKTTKSVKTPKKMISKRKWHAKHPLAGWNTEHFTKISIIFKYNSNMHVIFESYYSLMSCRIKFALLHLAIWDNWVGAIWDNLIGAIWDNSIGPKQLGIM